MKSLFCTAVIISMICISAIASAGANPEEEKNLQEKALSEKLSQAYREGYKQAFCDAYREAYREGHKDGYKLGYEDASVKRK
ncbi:MAG: hypothetical protein K2X27_04600 [Candidatus Obscuribacterales bacterium]|nr:hypothetical protein [Candidatus Obscuribacterales bacterium]